MKKIFILLFLFLACINMFAKDYSLYANPNALISVEEINNIISQDSNTVLIDTRTEDEFLDAHIPISQNLPGKTLLSSIKNKDIKEVLKKLGIKNNTHIIIYDDNGGQSAARLWWVLDSYGLKNISLIDGGLKAWKGKKFFVEIGLANYIKPTNYTLKLKRSSSRVISFNQIEKVSKSLDTQIVNVIKNSKNLRNKDKKDEEKSNYITLSWKDTLDLEQDSLFKPFEELKEIYGPLEDKNIITFNGNSGNGAHTAFILTQLLGYKFVKNYDKAISNILIY